MDDEMEDQVGTDTEMDIIDAVADEAEDAIDDVMSGMAIKDGDIIDSIMDEDDSTDSDDSVNPLILEDDGDGDHDEDDGYERDDPDFYDDDDEVIALDDDSVVESVNVFTINSILEAMVE